MAQEPRFYGLEVREEVELIACLASICMERILAMKSSELGSGGRGSADEGVQTNDERVGVDECVGTNGEGAGDEWEMREWGRMSGDE